MSKVEIFHPTEGTKEVSRSVLGPWRRAGWVLASDKPTGKNHLQGIGQSEEEESFVEDSFETELEEGGVANGSLDS